MAEPNTHNRMIVKSDPGGGEPLVVLGVVYAPGPIDTDGEAMTAEEIQKMAYGFMRAMRTKNIDLIHNKQPTGSQVVELFIARDNDPDFTPGSWVMATEIYDAALKTAIREGKLNGYSWGGESSQVLGFAHTLEPIASSGTVEPSTDEGPLPAHDHELTIAYDKKANIVPTRTSMNEGHDHEVIGATATELAYGHAHRIMIEVDDSGVLSVAA